MCIRPHGYYEMMVLCIIETEKKIVGTLYQDMVSNIFFRSIKIVTDEKLFIIDLVKNQIIENKKVKQFKKINDQIDLLKKNILLFKKRIVSKDYSLNDYDTAIEDLSICLKMHIEK